MSHHPEPLDKRMSDAPFTDQRDYLRVYFAEQDRHANFHYFWLRHNCPCCVHATTEERIISPADVPLEIKPQAIDATAAGICLTWPDDHQSTFSLEWLSRHRYSGDEDLTRIEAQNLDRIEVQFEDCADDLISACHYYLRDRGAILLRGCTLSTEDLVAHFTARDFEVRSTHFGYIEDLKTDNTTNDNTDQLGYTDAAVELHTDMPFIEEPPQYQILQCMEKATTGGDSMLADAQQAALYLRDLDRYAFDILCETPIVFHRQQQKYENKVTYPILSFVDSSFAQVRTSYFTFAPLDMPFDQMTQWYRAYQLFTRVLEDHRYDFLLEPGDCVLYSNFRMLHGRKSFAGPRWMRGIYLDSI